MWNHDLVKEYDGHEPTWELQAHVNGDLRAIADYGERHADHYGGCWLQDRHLYGVSFTESIGGHTAALESVVNQRERLRIHLCSASLHELRRVAEAIVRSEMGSGPNRGVVAGVVGVAPRVQHNVVEVSVLPGHPDVEARLRAAYGPLVSVVPGEIAYAFSGLHPGRRASSQG